MYKLNTICRICKNPNLVGILDLGEQVLTGVFPKLTETKSITKGPLRLVKCVGENQCGLVQLEHSYDLSEMYGLNYGYRSGLNKSMVDHLKSKVDRICQLMPLQRSDIVVDIGSNDGTTLVSYPEIGLELVGVDPTGIKFSHYYPKHIRLIADFFSAKLFKECYPKKKAKVITSFSMFYDLEDPISFMQDIYEVLADDGIWVFEQSYMPKMLETNSFDTVCHEHLEFYGLKQIQWMVDRVGLRIIDVEFNDTNGGSFSITVAKIASSLKVTDGVAAALTNEQALNLDSLAPYLEFAESTKSAKQDLLRFIAEQKIAGKRVAALGASTKGNVLLQYCQLTENDIESIGEVNAEKFGCRSPGTNIPIIPEGDLLETHPDILIILPWHFKSFFVANPKLKGFTLVFPLPVLEVVQL
jgi:NDP-4-keto-2,6-dideoxyhexose 3-C-methyltransferase